MKCVDLLARASDECDVDRPAGVRLSVGDDEVRELCAILAFPDRRDPERLEGGLVKGNARFRVADTDVDVVDDDTRPVPVAHAATLHEHRGRKAAALKAT